MTTALVPGSLQAVAQQSGAGLAETFLNADAIVLVDTSASMDACDVPGHTGSRYEVACQELARLQETLPGKIAVVSFSTFVTFCWDGKPRNDGGGTNLHRALGFVKAADGCGIKLIIISDGEPNEPDAALRVAKTFTTPIDTVYVGPEGGQGAAFLRRLADAVGGTHQTRTVTQLQASIAGLLTSGKAA